MSWNRVTKLSDLPIGKTEEAVYDDERVLVCRVSEQGIFAVEDCCSHDGGVLGQGHLDGDIIECPRHGGRFDVTTGKATRMPAVAPIQTYAVRISQDGWIEVEMEDA